jgi:hypothetical protein
MEIAYNWLQGLDLDTEDRKKLNLSGPSPSDEELVRGISWLMSLSAPTMIAIDQIDSIVAASNLLADKGSYADDQTELRARGIIQQGRNLGSLYLRVNSLCLINLKDVTSRSMTAFGSETIRFLATDVA